MRPVGRPRHGQSSTDKPVRVAVNVSPRQLLDLGIVDTVQEALRATGLPAGQLTLEITESLAMENISTAMQLLGSIKQIGVRFAMDDFGTGYSSLSYLTQLPIDVVKIDGSFTRRLGTDPQAASVMAASVKITKVAGLTVVAEGGETEEQLRMLHNCHCDYAQGYLFSKPVSPQEGGALIQRKWSVGHAVFVDLV